MAANSLTWQELDQQSPFHPNLNKPFTFSNGLSVRNRVVMSSMTRTRGTPEDHVNSDVIEYYRQRAEGGAGLILTEGALVSMQGTEYPNVPSLYTQEHADGWKKVVDIVHEKDSKIVCQLWHVGRVAHPDMPLQKKAGKPVSAPSAIRARGGNFRLLNNAEYVEAPAHPNPSELVEEFRQAAKYAKSAGFDGIELHGAAGYLVQQFLDKTSNLRDDKWGGSVENRTRFPLECLQAMAEVYGADKCGIKLNPCGGMNDIGMSKEDTIETYGHLIKEAVEMGVAYIQLVRYMPFMDMKVDGKMRACQLDVLETFGPLINGSKTAILYNGDLTVKEADILVGEGKIDAAVFGRPFVNNPDGQPMNEELGYPLNFYNLYNFDKNVSEGYTDYPTIHVALKAKAAAVKA